MPDAQTPLYPPAIHSAFAALAYLQYWHSRKYSSAVTLEELAERTRLSVEMSDDRVERLIRDGLLTAEFVPTLTAESSGNFFTLPDGVFCLGPGHGAITVYAYLLYCENHRTHQCHSSYNTITDTTGLSVNTVMKYVTTFVNKQLITVEHISYMDDKGMKWTGNNLYTVLPIQQAAGVFYQRQMNKLELTAERQRIAKFLQDQEHPAWPPVGRCVPQCQEGQLPASLSPFCGCVKKLEALSINGRFSLSMKRGSEGAKKVQRRTSVPAFGSSTKSHTAMRRVGAAGIKQGFSVCMRKLYHRPRGDDTGLVRCISNTSFSGFPGI